MTPPLLDDARRATLTAIVRDIADTLPPPSEDEPGNPTVAVGAAGIAIFLAHAARANLPGLDADRLGERMLEQLQAAIDGLPEVSGLPFLFEGFPGIGWAANHLVANGFLDEGEELCEAIDAGVLSWLEAEPAQLPCELIRGLAGLGLYGLARHHTDAGREIVRRVVDALDASTVVHEGRRTWRNVADEWSASDEKLAGGSYNLGLSHGVPGALVFLARAAAGGSDKAAALARSAADWLVAQARSYASGAAFAHHFIESADERGDDNGSRLAWCYGDLGISIALLIAARELRDPALEARAIAIAKGGAARTNAQVMDGCLCHGAFGNAHLFRRLFRATGEPTFGDAARHWLDRGIALRKPGEGLAGFRTWMPGTEEAPNPQPWVDDPGYLEGTSGMGLALLSFLHEDAPAWDALLMVDIPASQA